MLKLNYDIFHFFKCWYSFYWKELPSYIRNCAKELDIKVTFQKLIKICHRWCNYVQDCTLCLDGHYWCCFEAWWDYCDCPHSLIDPIWHTDCTHSQNAFCYPLYTVWWCEWYFSSQYLSACDALNVLHTIVSRTIMLVKIKEVTVLYIFRTRRKLFNSFVSDSIDDTSVLTWKMMF